MKKLFLSAGAFAGLAMSALALASCGESKETVTTGSTVTTTSNPTPTTTEAPKEVEVKDLDGKAYTIAPTANVDAVSKALILTSKNTLAETQEKIYAIEADLALNGNLSVTSLGGFNFKAELNGTAKAGVSIGKHKYARLTGDEVLTEAEYKKLQDEFFENFQLLAEADGSIKFTEMSIDEKFERFAELDKDVLAKDKEIIARVAGQSATARAKAFIYEGYGYTEVDAEAPKELVSYSLNDGNYYEAWVNYFHKYEKTNIQTMGSSSAMVTDLFGDYQELSLAGFVEENADMFNRALDGMGLPLSISSLAPVFEFSNIDATFFDSDAYKMVKTVVETLGVSVSDVKDGVVTFAVEINEEEIPALAKKLNVAEMVGVDNLDAILSALFSSEKSLLGVSVSIDAATGRFTNVTLTLDNIARIVTLLNAARTSLPRTISMYVPEEASGSLKLALDLKYNDDVNLTATPNPALTYVDPSEMR